jgi:hypothetical protein
MNSRYNNVNPRGKPKIVVVKAKLFHYRPEQAHGDPAG